MASFISHTIAAGALGQTAQHPLRRDWRFWTIAVLCSNLPDIDVMGFRFGIHYGDLWGHRGLTHSLLAAVIIGSLAAWSLRKVAPSRWKLTLLLIVITLSHGVLDAFTNGGLGVAFFSPFNLHRYFFPWRPVEVSPIGARFFTTRGWQVLRSESLWIWGPCMALGILLRYIL